MTFFIFNPQPFQDRVYVKNNKVDEVQDLGLKLFKELVSRIVSFDIILLLILELKKLAIVSYNINTGENLLLKVHDAKNTTLANIAVGHE